MDIAKYIGLFLLKNNFVYVHGLGQLEIKKKPSSYSDDALQPPAYDVFISQVGSIDDNLANFVATNEQVSISKASNALREFSMAARADIQSGKAVEIPGIGKFVEERGKMIFITDPNFKFTPAAIPAVKITRRQDETIYTATSTKIPSVKPKYEEDEEDEDYDRGSGSGSGISWVKITLWLAVLAIVAALSYFGYQYMRHHNGTEEPPLIDTPKQDTLPQMPPPVMIDSSTLPTVDSSLIQADTAVVPPPDEVVKTAPTTTFSVLLNSYTDEAKAKRRVDKLKSYGHAVRLEAGKDSSYLVVLSVSKALVADTAKLMDSLKRTFNPSEGVRVFK